MKKSLAVIILTLCWIGCFCRRRHQHNKIDDITNIQQLRSIFNRLIGEDSNRYFLNDSFAFVDTFNPRAVLRSKHYMPHGPERPFKILQAKLHAAAWSKADFDGNGYTDILLTGHGSHDPFVMCIMDSGNNHFALKILSERSDLYTALPVVTTVDGSPAIFYYHYQYNIINVDDELPIFCDTLVYKFGDFVEYNAKPGHFSFKRVDYKMNSTFRFDTTFIFSIHSNGLILVKYILPWQDGKEHQNSTYKAELSHRDYKQLIGLVKYINIPGLQDNYSAMWSDATECSLTLAYNDGKVKTIKDYGLLGSLGLSNLYSKLFALRFNQKLKKVKE